MRHKTMISLQFIVLLLLCTASFLMGQGGSPRSTTPAEFLTINGLTRATEFQMLCNPPVGSVVAFAGPWDHEKEKRTGWMLCNGRQLKRKEFSEVADVLGITNETDVFKLPNLLSRAVVGAAAPNDPDVIVNESGKLLESKLTRRTLNETGGEEEHVLTVEQIPAHSHPIKDPGHEHPVKFGTGNIGEGRVKGVRFDAGFDHDGRNVVQEVKTGITRTEMFGGGSAHPNMPPFLSLYYLIKVSSVPTR